MSNIIGQHVNLMDENSTIIASTDPNRIGEFHGGASRVIQEGLEQLVVREEDRLHGARQGINLPILYEGRTVGVIGLTGEEKEVARYGQIIRKMTEILLRDTVTQERRDIDRRIRDRFFDEWLHSEPGNIRRDLVDRGNMFGLDITLPRRVVIAAPAEMARYSDSPEGQRLLDRVALALQELAGDRDWLLYRTSSRMYLLTGIMDDGEMARSIAMVQERIQAEYGVLLAIGADSKVDGYRLIALARSRAEKALQACLASRDRLPRCYGNIDVELFIHDIPLPTRQEFVRRIFRDCTTARTAEWISLLKVFYRAEGSLAVASKQLHMHKNTLQYKLNKIRDTTGHDPRSLSECPLFYLAIQFWGEQQDTFEI